MVGLNPAQHIYWWLGSAQPHRGWARPSQPGPVTGPSQWPAGQTADARVKHFHACINSAKVIKLPSHCSNAIWTQTIKGEGGVPASGDDEEGCSVGVATVVRLLSSLSLLWPPSSFLLISRFLGWRSWEGNGYVCFFGFFFIDFGLLFLRGLRQ